MDNHPLAREDGTGRLSSNPAEARASLLMAERDSLGDPLRPPRLCGKSGREDREELLLRPIQVQDGGAVFLAILNPDGVSILVQAQRRVVVRGPVMVPAIDHRTLIDENPNAVVRDCVE